MPFVPIHMTSCSSAAAMCVLRILILSAWVLVFTAGLSAAVVRAVVAPAAPSLFGSSGHHVVLRLIMEAADQLCNRHIQ